MRISSRYKTFALLALLFWLMISWSGVHGHFCFDGQEPPISLHVDVVDGHEVHSADESHQDIDVDLSQSVITKVLKFDTPLALLLVATFLLQVLPRSAIFFPASQTAHPRRIVGLRPPSRAPPVTPA
ncbi:hypothetical protein [Cellvibrio sp. QJXJ]|uniref:Cobalt transporter n=1 Tax=Cellvibrio fibrivorans TaxID=126350 RepID=A0ABU1V3Y7_9GAMM|nr:hypothetical protein [Cellvibrio sp. QJXJ]MDR7092134.1 hypothetical protein [Cellvibrio fibrivorans]UUA74419.1 hypothetical protein NNX04_08250 [Cellvibrio sp. QJXJ]